MRNDVASHEVTLNLRGHPITRQQHATSGRDRLSEKPRPNVDKGEPTGRTLPQNNGDLVEESELWRLTEKRAARSESGKERGPGT